MADEDRNTFRLCIPQEQRGKLLKPDIWPSNITITPWSEKGKE